MLGRRAEAPICATRRARGVKSRFFAALIVGEEADVSEEDGLETAARRLSRLLGGLEVAEGSEACQAARVKELTQRLVALVRGGVTEGISELTARVAALEARVGNGDQEMTTAHPPGPSEAPTDPRQLGDTPEEITEGDRMASFAVRSSAVTPETWARSLIVTVGAMATWNERLLSGSHLRGLLRYLDRARAVVVAEVARADAERGKDSSP